MFKINRGSQAQLLKVIKALRAGGEKYLGELHEGAVSVLAHAARTGDTRPLNEFYAMLDLNVNWQTSFKLYVMRIQEDKTRRFLKFSAKTNQFSQLENVEKEKKAFDAYCESHLINPDGEDVRRFYERKIEEELMQFYDTNFYSQLKALMAKAKRHDTGTKGVDSKVSNNIIREGEKFLSFVENVVNAGQGEAPAAVH